MAATLLGCDAFYGVTIENRTDKSLIVSILARQIEVRPCSVVHIGSAAGPPPTRPIAYEARDTSGVRVQAGEVKAERGEGSGLPVLRVVVGPQDACVCPTPVTGRYVLMVENRTQREVQLLVHDSSLGHVAPSSSAQFGPLDGDWWDMSGLQVRSATGENVTGGQELLLQTSIDFDLGEVPEVRLYITPGWGG